MRQSLHTRLAKLENDAVDVPEVVVIKAINREEADRQIEEMRANGDLYDNQMVVVIRQFSVRPVPPIG